MFIVPKSPVFQNAQGVSRSIRCPCPSKKPSRGKFTTDTVYGVVAKSPVMRKNFLKFWYNHVYNYLD
jgi:hypothetical protein